MDAIVRKEMRPWEGIRYLAVVHKDLCDWQDAAQHPSVAVWLCSRAWIERAGCSARLSRFDDI
jgi:hypothetical protein